MLWLHLLSILRGLLRWLRANFGLKDAVTWLSILLGIAAGSFFFLPRVTVEPSGPYDPSHPTPLIFWIANTNIVPLRNVRVGIGICYIHVEGGPTLQGPDAKGDEHACNGPAKAIIYIERWHTRWLDADEKFEIPVEDGMNVGPRGQIEDANFTIHIDYTPWWMPGIWPWLSSREFRFATKKLSDGKIYWMHIPLNR